MVAHRFSDLSSVQTFVAEHERSTFTHFVTYNRNKHFGDEQFVPNVFRGRMHYWSHSGKLGVPIEYDGVPFMHVGRWSLICHQGRDIGAASKNKYMEKKKKLEQEGMKFVTSRKSSSKKVNCPAEIYISHIVKFPQFKVPSRLLSDNSLPSEQIRKINKDKLRLMHNRDPCKVVRMHCYYVRLPQPGQHQGHPFVAHVATQDSLSKANVVVSNTSTLDRRKINKNRDKHRRTREPMDGRVADKLVSLIKLGYCSTAVIRSELNKFVIQELFAGEAPPPAMFRRYNPTSRDIQNALHKIKQEAYESHRLELRTLCSNVLKDLNNSLSSIEDELTLGNLYKQLTNLRKQMVTGSDGEVLVDCSVSVHQLPTEDASSYQLVTVIEEQVGEIKDEPGYSEDNSLDVAHLVKVDLNNHSNYITEDLKKDANIVLQLNESSFPTVSILNAHQR